MFRVNGCNTGISHVSTSPSLDIAEAYIKSSYEYDYWGDDEFPPSWCAAVSRPYLLRTITNPAVIRQIVLERKHIYFCQSNVDWCYDEYDLIDPTHIDGIDNTLPR